LYCSYQYSSLFSPRGADELGDGGDRARQKCGQRSIIFDRCIQGGHCPKGFLLDFGRLAICSTAQDNRYGVTQGWDDLGLDQ
jgi:hypothetical protein